MTRERKKPSSVFRKSDLVSALAAEQSITQAEAKRRVDGLVRLLSEALRQNEALSISGFLSMSIGQRASRRGRDPATGNPIQLAARKVVRVKASRRFAEDAGIG